MQSERVELYCNKDGSDKVYVIELDKSQAGLSGYDVRGYNGPRGGSLTLQSKAQNVSYEEAKKTFELVLREKLNPRKGYQIKTSTASSETIAVSKPSKGEAVFHPELVEHINDSAGEVYLLRDQWLMQRKRDGRRLSVRKLGPGQYQGHNKLGQVIGLDSTLVKSLEKVQLPTFFTDGEIEGTGYWMWELLESYGADHRPNPYELRLQGLENCFAGVDKLLHVVETARTSADKRRMLRELHRIRAEGYCLHDRNAPFKPGRSGQIKAVKFVTECSVIVGPKERSKQDDGHRSVGMYVLDSKRKLVYVGSVGAPPKYELPVSGSVIDVRYLYAFPASHHLIQAKFLGKYRPDVETTECSIAQLKYKASE